MSSRSLVNIFRFTTELSKNYIDPFACFDVTHHDETMYEVSESSTFVWGSIYLQSFCVSYRSATKSLWWVTLTNVHWMKSRRVK